MSGWFDGLRAVVADAAAVATRDLSEFVSTLQTDTTTAAAGLVAAAPSLLASEVDGEVEEGAPPSAAEAPAPPAGPSEAEIVAPAPSAPAPSETTPALTAAEAARIRLARLAEEEDEEGGGWGEPPETPSTAAAPAPAAVHVAEAASAVAPQEPAHEQLGTEAVGDA
jgi:hypothetical protein